MILSASLLMFHFCCAADAALIPHSLHIHRGISTILPLSLWKGVVAFSPVWEHFSESPPCGGPDCAWDNLPKWEVTVHQTLLQHFFALISRKTGNGWGWTCLSSQGCVLLLPQAHLRVPLHLPISVQWSELCWEASILGVGPSTARSDNSNVFTRLPGLKTIWIPSRSVSNSLSGLLRLQRCSQQKHC